MSDRSDIAEEGGLDAAIDEMAALWDRLVPAPPAMKGN